MKAKSTLKKSVKLVAAMMLTIAPNCAFAQFNRTTYFMDDVNFKQRLNPAMAPQRGFINLPFLGAFNASVSSNSISAEYIDNLLSNANSADYFTTDKFVSQLKENNRLSIALSNDLASAGWYSGKGFWNVNLTIRADIDANMNRDAFEFLRAGRGMSTQSWANANLFTHGGKAKANMYLETGLGYARPVTERLVLGVKVKMLFGIADLTAKVQDVTVKTNLQNINPHQDWSAITEEELQRVRGKALIKAHAEVDGSLTGLTFIKDDKQYIKDWQQYGSTSFAGYGAAVDLGTAYKLGRDFTLSAAVLDLGFIKWGKDNSIKGVSEFQREYDFDGVHAGEHRDEFKKTIESGSILNQDLWNMKEEESKSRTTKLRSTLVLGAQYKLLNDKLTVGALSTTRLGEINTQQELTFAGSFSFTKQVALAVSYSVIQSQGKGLGLGLKLGPLTVATDYMYFGKDSRTASALLGITIPLGRRHRDMF